MHIIDNILDPPVWIGGYVAAGIGVEYSLRRVERTRVPEIGVLTGLYFVATLIQFPLMGTSVHLLLNGLMGILLRWASVPAILVAVFLQAILVGEGGVTTIGILTCILGSGALVASGLFHGLRSRARSRLALGGLALLATTAAIVTSGALYVLVLSTAGKEIQDLAWFAIVLHLPVAAIEGIVSVMVVVYLSRVLPGVLLPAAATDSTRPLEESR